MWNQRGAQKRAKRVESESARKVVLMLGSQTDTGKVISKKLLSSGYHVARRGGDGKRGQDLDLLK